MKTAIRSLTLLGLSPLLLSLGLAVNFAIAPKAQACSGTINQRQPKPSQAFEFANGLKLGLPSSAIVETLGQPQQQVLVNTGSRCGSVLEQFSYDDNATVISVDRPLPVKSIRRHSAKSTASRLAQVPDAKAAGMKAIVRIYTQSPKRVFNGQIRVGDGRQKVIQVYGEPQMQQQQGSQKQGSQKQGSMTQLWYTQNGQVLSFTIDAQAKISAIELVQAEPEMNDILAQGL
jgi:hypothetical protein